MPGLQLAGAAVVITGAGSGIGAALARRFAAEGARLLLNDRDPAAVTALADELGAAAHPADMADPAAVLGLVGAAYDTLGELDLFCANAGIGTAGGPEAPDALWQQAFDINVMSHVYAARALLPRWLDRGRGRLLTTVSAAGLLTMLGSAPYSVTKHAAMAFSEWLRATYAHRGIVVQSLCPQGVLTPLLDGTGAWGAALLEPGAITPEQCAEAVVQGLSGDGFLILPHPEVANYLRHKATDPDRWLAGMNRVQQGLERP